MIMGIKKRQIYELLETLREEGFLENNEKAGIIFTPNVNGDVGCYNVCNYINNIYGTKKANWYSGSIPKIYIHNERIDVMTQDEFDEYKK